MKKRVLSAFLCAMMIATMAVGCGSKDASKDAGSDDKGKIVVGGKSFTEAYLLSEIYADALEDNGYEVERVYDMNTDTISPAIQNGEIDMYPEYTGTALTDVLGLDMETDTDKVYESVSKGYEDKWNITWLDMTTMEDKVAIVMLKGHLHAQQS